MVSLSGEWQGTFTYCDDKHTTPFIATITDRVGMLTGHIIEPDEICPGSMAKADLSGLITDCSVDFTKTYRGSRLGYENPVDYFGQLAENGLTIFGNWILLELDGTFEMHRDTIDEPVAEQETQIELVHVSARSTSEFR